MLTDLARKVLARHWQTNRTPVSAAARTLAYDLADNMPGADIVTIPAGARVLDWEIPLSWEVRSAKLFRNGRLVVDYADNPALLWAHSQGGTFCVDSMEGHASDKWCYRGIYRPDWRGWGFLTSQSGVANYRAEIDATLDRSGHMAYVDATIPGRLPETILFCAHTCHPGQVADGIGNCLLLMDLYREMHLKGTRYTYRFVLGPETYTAAAWLEANRNQRVAGGVYVDFLAAPSPLIWQRTLAGGQIDRIMRAALGVDGLPFRAEFGNDERFYAARPWSLPMAVLGRKLWAGYHTAADTPDNCPDARWAEGASALRAIVQALEDDCCPLVDMPGPICRSRHGLYDDSLTMREHEAVEQLQFHADGQTPLVEIAHRTGASFGFLARWLGKFQAAGLAVAPAPARAPLADNPGFPAPECEEQRP